MTEPAPIFIVFGIDAEGKARASRFGEPDAELATKAAILLGFRSAWIKDEAGRDIAEALPNGNVFARGNGFVRLVRPSMFERLSGFIDAAGATTPEHEGSNDQ
jgi:hypothetical protein